SELVGELEALIARHPLRERLRVQLMLALYRCDRQSEALQAYQEARRLLVAELGLEPGRRLRELEQTILRHDTSFDRGLSAAGEADGERTSAAALSALERTQRLATHRRPDSVFVGREPELAELRVALEEAFAGQGRLFLICGEPGIGKSRLAEELASEAK